MERIAVFVDGFNVYYGMKRKGWQRYLWLDYRALFENMVRSGQQIEAVHYFTALSNLDGSRQRQQTYLNALGVRGGLTVHMGRIEPRPVNCKKCGQRSHKRNQEKESDVAMAIEMLLGAVKDDYDSAWLMTNDSDLRPAVAAVVELGKKVVIVRPPNGTGSSAGDALVQASTNGPLHIGRSIWSRSQLPEELQAAPGQRRQRRPKEWM